MKALTRVARPRLVVCLFVLAIAPVLAKAQCVNQPSGKSAIAVMNASDYFITFYVDGVKQARVFAQERSLDFSVSPGRHVLMAESIINGETLSATRTLIVPAGSICTWNVTNPTMTSMRAATSLFDSLSRSAVITLVAPN
jgi:hypothetical protein